jgi:hypothetical protein
MYRVGVKGSTGDAGSMDRHGPTDGDANLFSDAISDTEARNTRRPATPPGEVVLDAPHEGASLSSPVQALGRVSVIPFEGTLRGRIYDSLGRVVGEKPIQARADVEGDLGGPGTFVGPVPFDVAVAGPGLVEVAEISVRDCSIVVSATVAVTLTGGAGVGG